MKPSDVNSSAFIGIKKENNKKDLKVDDHVNISKYKNIFAKGYVPNWSKEVFVVKKVKNTVPWKYVTSNLNGEEMVGTFYEKELKEQIKKKLIVEKVVKRKGSKLYVKWKGYDNFLNRWIDKRNSIIE